MLNQDQQNHLAEIERLIGEVRAADAPCPPCELPHVEDPSDIIPVTGTNLQVAITEAPEGATLDLLGKTFPQAIVIDKPLTLQNGAVFAPVNTSDLVNIKAGNVKLSDIRVMGDNATTKNGIVGNGIGLVMRRLQVLDIGRPNQESHAFVCWNGSEIDAEECTFQGGAMAVLFGGNGTTVPNHVPSNLRFHKCEFSRPSTWKGRGWGSKTLVEFKNARNVSVTSCLLQNNWQEGPQGHAITITASNYDGRSPETITENIEFRDCQILDVNGGVLGIGYGQHHYKVDPYQPTLRGNNYRFINNTWRISKALNGGQGALLTTGCEPLNILFEGNTHQGDGDAMIRVNDSRVGHGLIFRNNPRLMPGTYGIFSPLGARGGSFHMQFLESLMEGNTFVNAHYAFKNNFPSNVYQ